MPTLGRIKWRRCESRESSLRYVKRELRPHRQQHVLANRPHCGGPPWRRPGGWRGGNVRGEPTVTVSNVRDKVSALNVRSSPLRREDVRANPTAAGPAGAGSRRPRPDAAAMGRISLAGRTRVDYAGREQAVRSKIAAGRRAAVGRARGFACFGVNNKPASRDSISGICQLFRICVKHVRFPASRTRSGPVVPKMPMHGRRWGLGCCGFLVLILGLL